MGDEEILSLVDEWIDCGTFPHYQGTKLPIFELPCYRGIWTQTPDGHCHVLIDRRTNGQHR